MIEQLTKHPIDPFFDQSQPNDPIDLGNHDISYEIKGTTFKAKAAVHLRFSPDIRLVFKVPISSISPSPAPFHHFGVDGYVNLTLTNGINIEAILTSSRNSEIVFLPRFGMFRISQTSDQIRSARFHLFNFPILYGPDRYSLETQMDTSTDCRKCSRTELKADNWVITICEVERSVDLLRNLKENGGYALTGVGQIVREDGSTFDTYALEKLFSCLHSFFSFAFGRWMGIGLTRGFDAKGINVYERWGLPFAANNVWNPSITWFDAMHAGLLGQVFPGFVKLWNNPIWHEPLSHVIYWYVNANDRRAGAGVDNGLILAQSALETLAWTYCTQDRKMVSSEAFKQRGLSAADKIRLLTSALNIPREIPDSCKSLKNQQVNQWVDGPHAITSIRNSLVHPIASCNSSEVPFFEAWNLALWYIELVLLHLCGHKGQYANHLKLPRRNGEVEDVPWAKKTGIQS